MDSYPVLLGLKPANCGFDVFVAVALSSMEKLPFPLQDLSIMTFLPSALFIEKVASGDERGQITETSSSSETY